MSEVTRQPVPVVGWKDWATIFVGLGVGIGLVFEIIRMSVTVKQKKRVYNWTNFWLIMSGVIHVWIEYNFVFARSTSAIKTGLDLYAAADWRYGDYGGLMESGTTAMEAITALIVGPLCFLVALAHAHDWGCRHPLQLVLCTMQLYGLIWFTLQPVFSHTGMAGHFSSDPVLFWAVAVGCNAPWAIFPTILWVISFFAISDAMWKQQ